MKTPPWDPLNRLKTDEARAAYRDAAQEFGDDDLIIVVKADIARAEQRYEETCLKKLYSFRGKMPAAKRLSRDAANDGD